MKAVPAALLALVCIAPLAASAQWQWLDKDGRKVFSDQAPPPDIAPNRILKAPGGRAPAAEAPAAAATPTAAPSPAAKAAAKGTDKSLEDKKKAIAAAEEEKQKAEEAKVASAKAENCSRARAAKAHYDSGMRIARMNDKGEREILDDAQRTAEMKTINDAIGRDCK